MFLYKVGNDYFDVLTKTYISTEELAQKRRYSFVGNQINVLDDIRRAKSFNEMYVVLTITTACNLACAYCFENGTQRHSMSKAVMLSTLDDIKSYASKNKIKKLYCTLFGGEPLLEQAMVDYVTTELHEFCQNNGIALTVSMTTNGLIVNESLFETLHNHSLKTIQITFDGSKEMNNARRKSRFQDIKDPYTTILDNLNVFVRIFDNINIKYNFDKQNISDFEHFLDDLTRVVVDPKDLQKIVILVEPIQGTHHAQYAYNYQNTDKELAVAYIKIISKLIEANINYRSKVFNTPCMATSPNSFLIDPDGNCSCCISNFEQNELSMGKFSDVTYESSVEARNIWNRLDILNKHCKDCEFLAGCWGGCLYDLSVNGHDCRQTVNCRKNFFENVVQLFYKELYLKKGVKRID